MTRTCWARDKLGIQTKVLQKNMVRDHLEDIDIDIDGRIMWNEFIEIVNMLLGLN
jgi:CRISPR/Cas system-associated endonuclease Cas3-HD